MMLLRTLKSFNQIIKEFFIKTLKKILMPCGFFFFPIILGWICPDYDMTYITRDFHDIIRLILVFRNLLFHSCRSHPIGGFGPNLYHTDHP